MTMQKIKIAYVLTHPIQYQVPMIKYLNQQPDLYIKVFYCSDMSTKQYYDSGFGQKIEWDVPLLDGYDYEFFPAIGSRDKITFARPYNHGLMQHLKQGGFDAVWLHGYSRLVCLQIMAIAKILGIKVLVRDEAWLKSKQRHLHNLWVKQLWFRILNRFADAFLAIGSCNKDYYLANGISADKIFSVPYVVDNRFFQDRCKHADVRQLRAQLDIPGTSKIILYASKLIGRKKLLDLISAYGRIVKVTAGPKPFLVIVGSGELKNEAHDLIKTLDIAGFVRMCGFINQTDLPTYYKACDVFVLPSENEPWGLAVNEAMNCGAAIVASDEVGSAFDLIENGINGYRFKAGNIEDLSDKLLACLKDSEKFGAASLSKIDCWGFSQVAKGLKQALEID